MDSNITKLPKDLLSKIFDNLTLANDRRRAAQVCKLFYAVLRDQPLLKQENMLKMTKTDFKASPIRVFQNSEFFPFSKLRIVAWHQNVILEAAFWQLHGQKISEINFDGYRYETILIETFLSTLSKYFPNIKKLTIGHKFSKSDSDNSVNILLPIEDLTLDTWTMPLDQTLDLLRCSPLLKNLEINWYHEDQLPQILPWLETIESSRIFLNEEPLGKLSNLPIKVVIGHLTIKSNDTPKMIREFIKLRKIETLTLNLYDRETDPNTIYSIRDQVLALNEAKSIKNVNVCDDFLQFEGALDLLGQLPGLENITLEIAIDLPNPLNPFYWSSPVTAQKIREIYVTPETDVPNLDHLVGLSSLTTISITEDTNPMIKLSSDDIQTLIRNCQNLKTLSVPIIDATDAELIVNEDLLPISSLEKLESLDIFSAPNITSEAFKSAFKFPNLKSFKLVDSSVVQIFNQHVAKLFTQNCPNLEDLTMFNCPINEEGFDYLIRHLPYLRFIHIEPPTAERHLVSKDIIEELQKEFPYIKIVVDEYRNEW